MRTPALLLVSSMVAVAALAGTSRTADAVPIRIIYTDSANEGFNDPTLGPARRACIEAAAANWANRLQGTVPIDVEASFDPLGGTANSAILGGAMAYYNVRNFSASVPSDTFYPGALANQIVGQDIAPQYPEILIQYNSDVDGPVVLSSASFYYGTDGRLTASGGQYYDIDFYQTCFHELGHGLGFASQFRQDGSYFNGYPGLYDTYLVTGSSASAPKVTLMSQAQRASALISNSLYFNGPNARTAAKNTNPRIYAPTTFESGSSRSHLNETTYSGTSVSQAHLNECMTPYLGPGVMHHPGPIVSGVFEDIGWHFTPYTRAEASKSLRAIAGLSSSSETDVARLKREGLTAYPGRLGIVDTLRAMRGATGTDPKPHLLGTP